MKPYYEQDGIEVYHGDCREVLGDRSILWNRNPVAVTDPPYGTGGWRRAVSGAGSNPAAGLVRESWDDGAVDWLALFSGPVLTFWPAASAVELLHMAVLTRRTKHRTLYMRKRDPKPQVGGRVRWSVEPIWVLSGDGFILLGGDDVIEASTPREGRDDDATGHPYQKPDYVMEWLVAKIRTDFVILDPFMGCGTTLVAAKRLGRLAIGIEAEERWCEVAVKRLQQRALPLATTPTEPSGRSMWEESDGAA